MKIFTLGMATTVLVLQGHAPAQVIEFETLPDGTPVTDGMLIRDQYDVDPYWVRFELVDADSTVGPRIAEVGPPMTAFQGPEVYSACSGENGYSDKPAPGEPVGCFFLTDDNELGFIAEALRISYSAPVFQASGHILDIESPSVDESWSIKALREDHSIIDTIIMTEGDPGTGDGVATLWAFDLAEEIHAIELEYTGTTGAGLAFDNFSPASLPSDLTVEKTGPTSVTSVGDTLMYSLSVTNNGPGDATSVSLQDFLPPGVSLISAIPSQGSCSEVGGVVTCQLETVVNSASATVEVVGILQDVLLLNIAKVSCAQLDLSPSDNADSMTTTVQCVPTGLPEPNSEGVGLSLGMNRPNPFGPGTTIFFTVDRPKHVTVSVHDAAGRLVTTLVDEVRDTGPHTVEWNGRDAGGKGVSSGVYFLRMEAGDKVKSRKVTILR
jgi:uncharacterized repeat protein (TIGR01451 family)